MSRFAEKVALVFGGTGRVGTGVVKSFVDEGATVIVPSRSKERLEALSVLSNKISGIEGDISTLEGAEKLKQEIQSKFQKIDYVVVSIGVFVPVSNTISKISKEEYESAFSGYCTPHWIVAKTFLPILTNHESQYLIITGIVAEMVLGGLGHLTLGNAALCGLSLALQDEYKSSTVKVNEYRIGIRTVKDNEVKSEMETATSKVGKAITNSLLQDARGKIFKLASSNLEDQIANKF